MRWENVADEKIVGTNSAERRPAALSCDPGFCTPVLGRQEPHRRVSHLQPHQPHVTYYTRLHGMESEVIFLGDVASVVYCRLSIRHRRLVASLPISVNGWRLAVTPLPPTRNSSTVNPCIPQLILHMYKHLFLDCSIDARTGRGAWTRPCGLQREILRLHILVSKAVIGWSDRSGIPEVLGHLPKWSFLLILRLELSVCSGLDRRSSQWLGGVRRLGSVSGRCCSILANRWVSFFGIEWKLPTSWI